MRCSLRHPFHFATVVGAFAGSQMGWSGTKAIVKVFEGQDALTDFLFGFAMLVLFGVLRYIRRVARRALWVAVPIWATTRSSVVFGTVS